VLALLLAASVGPPDFREADRSAQVVCATVATDLASTELVLARGGHELLVQPRWARVSLGALGCYGITEMAKKNPEKARKWAKAAVVLRVGLTFWNVREALK
jgi:hypothetical protein